MERQCLHAPCAEVHGAPARLWALAYLEAEEAPLYRAVMRVFLRAKESFVLQLRAEDVHRGLLAQDVAVERREVESALQRLSSWQNLSAEPDTAEVQTVEDFYRERWLYQLTPQGEAAHRALLHVERQPVPAGESQSSALTDIRAHLAVLLLLAEEPTSDGAKVHRTFQALFARCDELADEAQTFVEGLPRSVELRGVEASAFFAHKARLLDHLERFASELTLASIEVSATLDTLDASVAPLLDTAAERSTAECIDGDRDFELQRQLWSQRWARLRRWFMGDGQGPSPVELLRRKALAAIPSLLAAAQTLHDRRVRRADLHRDFVALARWFAQTPNATTAHRLSRAAFGLHPARHLGIDDESVAAWERDGVGPQTRWRDAQAVRSAPRLRALGRHERPDGPRAVVDRSGLRRQLALVAAAEHAQVEQARRWLLSRGRRKLSELGELEGGAFELFLELLGAALVSAPADGRQVQAASTDGSLLVVLSPVAQGGLAQISTSTGILRCRDHVIEIVRAEELIQQEAAE